MITNEIAEQFLNCTTEEQLNHTYQQFMLGQGFDNYAISSFTDDGPVIHAGHVPAGWEEYYMQQEYWKIDPVFQAQATTWTPHYWSDLIDEGTSKAAIDFIYESEDAGLKSGHTVSLRHMNRKTNFAMSSSEQLDEHTLRWCISTTFAVSSMYAAKRALLLQGSQRIQLSKREREVTKWIVAGKTNSEIGDLMGIADKTVEEFIRRICRKNNLSNRLAIAVRAVVDGVVEIE